jgi:[protein-PII] uridylyltransferase
LNPVTSPREIERIEKMMQDEFGVDECMVNFDALIEKQATPSVTQAEPPNFDIPQRVIISNEEEPNSTVLNIQAQDRIGLLYEIFTILGNLNAEVLNARISTQAGAAIDRLSLVDFSDEKKITDPERLAKIEESIQKCLDSRPTVEVLK